jgi:hypothetical protein
MCICAIKTRTNKPESILYYNESMNKCKVVVIQTICRKIIRCEIIDKITLTISQYLKEYVG